MSNSRKVLVVGASRGMGLAITRELITRGSEPLSLHTQADIHDQ